MKFDKQKAFPYPVLRPYSDDFIDKEFQSTADFIIEGNKVTVEISYALSSKDILALIDKKIAVYVSVLACRDTYFSISLKSHKNNVSKEFDGGLFKGEVQIRSYIYISSDYTLSSREIHPDFGSDPIQYRRGDIIAQDETEVFYFDRDLFRPVSSVFDLVKKESLSDGEWTLSFEQDHVQIEVSPAMKEAIDNARNDISNRAVLINSIMFAAVMQSIEKIRNSDAIYDEYKWAQVIKHSAHNNSIDVSAEHIDSYLIAERLMHYPLSKLNTHFFKKGAE